MIEGCDCLMVEWRRKNKRRRNKKGINSLISQHLQMRNAI
jgi:hypothetical protein